MFPSLKPVVWWLGEERGTNMMGSVAGPKATEGVVQHDAISRWIGLWIADGPKRGCGGNHATQFADFLPGLAKSLLYCRK